jgi:hypothetical protein
MAAIEGELLREYSEQSMERDERRAEGERQSERQEGETLRADSPPRERHQNPSSASHATPKVATGSRILRKRNSGRGTHCQVSHGIQPRRSRKIAGKGKHSENNSDPGRFLDPCSDDASEWWAVQGLNL